MSPLIPEAWEMYYYVAENGTIKETVNSYKYLDIYNIMVGNCFYTEPEAVAMMNEQQKIYNEFMMNAHLYNIESKKKTD